MYVCIWAMLNSSCTRLVLCSSHHVWNCGLVFLNDGVLVVVSANRNS